jgi:hypothetical protein
MQHHFQATNNIVNACARSHALKECNSTTNVSDCSFVVCWCAVCWCRCSCPNRFQALARLPRATATHLNYTNMFMGKYVRVNAVSAAWCHIQPNLRSCTYLARLHTVCRDRVYPYSFSSTCIQSASFQHRTHHAIIHPLIKWLPLISCVC